MKVKIQHAIFLVRGKRVMLDSDLAAVYGVATKVLVQGVSRNINRFPVDFMCRLTRHELTGLRSQFVTSNVPIEGRGGRRHLPYVFTEQGVAMLSSVLRSPRAIQANIAIMRAFVRVRALPGSNEELERKLEDLEKKYSANFKIVFDAIRELMSPPTPQPRAIGFRSARGPGARGKPRERFTLSLQGWKAKEQVGVNILDRSTLFDFMDGR